MLLCWCTDAITIALLHNMCYVICDVIVVLSLLISVIFYPTEFTVTRFGTCAAYSWVVEYSGRGGDQEEMVVDGSDLKGQDVRIKVFTLLNGGTKIRPLRGAMLRIPEVTPQVHRLSHITHHPPLTFLTHTSLPPTTLSPPPKHISPYPHHSLTTSQIHTSLPPPLSYHLPDTYLPTPYHFLTTYLPTPGLPPTRIPPSCTCSAPADPALSVAETGLRAS